MKDTAGKRGASTKTQYQRVTIPSNNQGDKQVTRVNPGNGNKFRITQEVNGKTFVGRGASLNAARAALEAAKKKK